MSLRSGRAVAAVLAAAAVFMGCPTGPQGEWAGECVRAEAVTQSPLYRGTCLTDDNCACGQHCDLGVCASACQFNTDCEEGSVCDGFGRCTLPELANKTPKVQGGERGFLLVDRSQLDLYDPSSVEQVRVAARVRALETLRAVAEPGLEVSCDGSTFAAQCTFGPQPVDAPGKTVAIRHTGAWPADDVRTKVTVHAPGQHFTVGVLKRGAPPPEAPLRHGVYEGKARLVGAGLKARTPVDSSLPAELARLELPIRAEVFPETGGTYAVKLYDVRNTVFAQGAVGLLQFDPVANGWTLNLPSRQYLGEDVAVPDADALDVHVSGQLTGGTFSQGLLHGDLVSTFEGISPSGIAPFARWRISLTRVGALPAGANPPAVEPRPVAAVATRASTPFGEETVAETNLAHAGLNPLDRSIATICSPNSGTIRDSFVTARNANGDLLCEGTNAPLTFGVEQGFLVDRGPYLDSCVEALTPAASPSWPGVPGGSFCALRTRVVASLAYALQVDRERAFGSGAAANAGASKLAQRLVQQWMGTQALTALEPRRLFRIASLLPGGPDVERLRFYAQPGQVFQTIQTSIAGWDLLLHPRVGSALANMSPVALVTPDYRSELVGGTHPAGEMSIGLPTAMLNTLTRQLEGLEGLIDDLTHLRTYGGERARVAAELSKFLPRNVVIFATASGLHDAARSQAVPNWAPLWEGAKVRYGTAAARLVDSIYLLESGRNPLGIEDDDLPLYRLGDQTGSRRFSAVSDSLLGREDLLDPAIAPELIDRAREAELLARTSVSALLQRDLTEALLESDTDRRLESIHRFYGDQITSLCGQMDSLVVLNDPDQVDPDTCFLAPGCTFTESEYNARLSTADLGYQVCLAAKLRERFGEAVTTGQAELDRQLSLISPRFTESTPFSGDFGTSILNGFTAGYTENSPPNITLPAGVDQNTVRQVEALCDSARAATNALRPSANPTSCDHADDCAVGFTCDTRSNTCVVESQDLDPTCFLGSLGESAIAIRAASTDVDIARSELEELTERYDNAMRGCMILEQGNAAIEGAITAHNNTMAELANAKFAADTAAKVAEKAANIFSVDKIWQAVGTAIFGAIQQAAESTADTLALKMENAERQHELTLQKLENATEERLCYNEAEAELVGARSAALRVKRQTEELAAAISQFNNLKINVGAAVADGLASLQSERDRAVSPPNVDHWLDANVDLYDQRMRRARRALYLAVLAVEYEFQFTSSERATVLAAQTPTQLEAALARLRDYVRRGAPPGGGNPSQLIAVVSLRKNLLQVADRSDHPEGVQALTAVERFRRMLVAPEYAVYDRNGRYLGQEIPFSLQPLGTLGLADTGAVPLLSGLSCAERLWAVNASVHGSGLMNGTDTTIATLQVRKRNTFSSQWCGTGPRGQAQQLASTRPSQNLFVDPLSSSTWREDDVVSGLTNTQEASAFSWATVQARLNVDRRSLEQVAYQDGASVALAGRGVFGDYTLFIPATTQSIGNSVGLQLQNVDDVLIRFDYVAAERQ